MDQQGWENHHSLLQNNHNWNHSRLKWKKIKNFKFCAADGRKKKNNLILIFLAKLFINIVQWAITNLKTISTDIIVVAIADL